MGPSEEESLTHRGDLLVLESHPVQYHAPVYRAVQTEHGVPLTVLYGSDRSVSGYLDAEFGTNIAWDVDLLSGYRPIFLTNRRGPGSPALQIATQLRSLRPAAVLAVGYASSFDRSALAISVATRQRLMLRAETTDHATTRSNTKAAVRDAVLRRLYRRIAQLLYVGTHSLNHYRRLGVPPERLTFSPYCIDADVFRWTERERTGQRDVVRRELSLESRDVILFSGKLSERKGVKILLEAVAGITSARRSELGLLFVGAGALEQEIRNWARAHPEIELKLVGFQPQTRLSGFYHAADVLVLPSLHSETWGLVVNEALQHGVACVVTDAVGCAPDLITDATTGVVCDTGSVEALRHGIEKVLALPKDARRRDLRRAIVSRYSASNAALGIANAFQRITE